MNTLIALLLLSQNHLITHNESLESVSPVFCQHLNQAAKPFQDSYQVWQALEARGMDGEQKDFLFTVYENIDTCKQ